MLRHHQLQQLGEDAGDADRDQRAAGRRHQRGIEHPRTLHREHRQNRTRQDRRGTQRRGERYPTASRTAAAWRRGLDDEVHALAEDLGDAGDITTNAVVPAAARAGPEWARRRRARASNSCASASSIPVSAVLTGRVMAARRAADKHP